MKRKFWTEKEIKILKKHDKTVPELSLFLNRSKGSIVQKLQRLNMKRKRAATRIWTEKEIKILQKKEYTMLELSKILNRTYDAILAKYLKLGIHPKIEHQKWTNKEINIIKKYKTIKNIQKYLHRTRIAIHSKAEKLNIPIEGEQKSKDSVNHNYFKKWTPSMSYIFGLWCADGNIYSQKKYHSSNYNFRITLNEKYILEGISKIMKFKNKLHHRKNCNGWDLPISSKTIYYDIIKLGGCPRKSLILEFPYIPKKYLSDFIRGFFDGDGYVKKMDTQQYCIAGL